jgi:deoxyribodipyrimidine photo-lyase
MRRGVQLAMFESVAFPAGRGAALAALARIAPSRYARSRNFLDGAVTRLSPYLRHGVLSLSEVRDAALARGGREAIEKFVQELGWRDYYRRVWSLLGDRLWDDLEAYKTGYSASAYADEMPPDIARGETGAACIDASVEELETTGYVHNHARMWFASYVVHHRRVAWQAGARFYLERLLDGDVASNNLSWQWVASTFAHKPYFFDRANVARYTRDAYCATCPLATSGCPFDASYPDLARRLFPNGERALDDVEPHALNAPGDAPRAPSLPLVAQPAIVWQHDESLSREDAARTAAPAAPAIFVWDTLARERDPWNARRARFVEETLATLDLARIARGDTISELASFARERGARSIVTVAPVDPRLRAIARALRADFDVVELEPPPFATIERAHDLRRYSRYWRRAERTAFELTPSA